MPSMKLQSGSTREEARSLKISGDVSNLTYRSTLETILESSSLHLLMLVLKSTKEISSSWIVYLPH